MKQPNDIEEGRFITFLDPTIKPDGGVMIHTGFDVVIFTPEDLAIIVPYLTQVDAYFKARKGKR